MLQLLELAYKRYVVCQSCELLFKVIGSNKGILICVENSRLCKAYLSRIELAVFWSLKVV